MSRKSGHLCYTLFARAVYPKGTGAQGREIKLNISSAVYIFTDEKKRIDKFGPNDGHPLIAGFEVFHFLQDRLKNNEIDKFNEIVKGCHFIKYDETRVDARTDKSSDILGLLWRKGSMDLYDSEDYADVCDYVYQIDLDERTFRILGSGELVLTFDEISGMTDERFADEVNRVFE